MSAAELLSALGDPKIGPVLGEIHARPEAAWNLETLAAVAGASRSVFAEQFKALTGNPPMQYLKLWRVQVANDLLLSTDLAVAQIAERVGYASDVAFRKAFSEQMGVTPAAARRGTQPARGK